MPEFSFFRKLSVLAGGSIVGQALVVISSPLLTRFFSPEEFGVFAVFSAIIGILGILIGLRFELAIASSRERADAAAMVLATAGTSAVMASLVMVATWLFGKQLAAALNLPMLAPWLWLLGPAALIWGIGSALSYWSIRHGRYRSNAANRILQYGTQAGSQVSLGFLQTGAPGLVAGYLLGYVARVVHYVWQLPRADRALVVQSDWRTLVRLMRENWRYPVYVVPSAFLQTVCQLGPAILIAALYGPAIAGLYALSQRIIGLPMRMLSEAASKVFLGEAREFHGLSLRQYFRRTTALFAALALLGSLPLLLFAPGLFEIVFGSVWRESGILIQLLAPLYLVRFIVQPTSQLLYMVGRQDIYFVSSMINAAAFIFSFGCAYFFELDVKVTVLLFSVTSSLSFVFNFVSVWLVLRGGGELESLKDQQRLAD